MSKLRPIVAPAKRAFIDEGMPRNRSPISHEHIAAFVRNFSAELGRRDRQKACVAYLEWLLGFTTISESRQVLRNFVNRSPWCDEAMMRQLRALLWKQTKPHQGWLGLTELTLSKAGFASVGCESTMPRYVSPPRTRSRQRIVVWFWLCGKSAWPVAARLYLPSRWTKPRSEQGGIPSRFRSERSRGQIALDLLSEMDLPEDMRPHVVVSEHFSSDWGLLEKVFEKATFAACRMHPMAPWPIDTPHLPPDQSMTEAQWLTQYLHSRENLALMEKMLRLKKKRGFVTKRLPIVPHAVDALRRRERAFITNINEDGLGEAFLANRADATDELPLSLEQLRLMAHARDNLTIVMRKFEGRTWRGLHHHLALAALTQYFVSMQPFRRLRLQTHKT